MQINTTIPPRSCPNRTCESQSLLTRKLIMQRYFYSSCLYLDFCCHVKPKQGRFIFDVYIRKVWASYITHPTPRSRITSLVRTSNANTHTEYDCFCHTDIKYNDATAQNHTQSGVTIAFLTRDSSVSGLILPSCEFGSQISVVTPISIYAFCLSIQTVVQSATAKVRTKSQISFTLL